MKTIQTRCPNCQALSGFEPDEVHLHLGTSGDVGRYGFLCPSCGIFAVLPADDIVTGMLTLGGAGFSQGERAPWEPAPSARPSADGALALDDLDELMAELDDPDLIARLDRCG